MGAWARLVSAGVLGLAVVGSSGARGLRSRQPAEGPPTGPLDYSKHGGDWGWGSCKSSVRQSPVNIEQPLDAPVQQSLEYKYEAVKAPITGMGDGFFTFPAGSETGGIVYEQNFYGLQSAQIHTDSEHTVYGKHSLFELQLFHKMPGRDTVVAVAIRFEPPPPSALAPDPVRKVMLPNNESETILSQLLALGEQAPGFNRPIMHFLDPAKTSLWNALNLNELFRSGSFWEYQGSLTRPPCSEVATWLVRRDTLSLSPRQAQLLYSETRKTIRGVDNRRDVHALGERGFRIYGANEQREVYFIKDKKAPSVDEFVPVGPNPREDRTDRLNGYAQAAFEASNEADQAGQELNYRVQNAAYQHAKEMAPYLMRFVPPPEKPKFDAYEYAGWNPDIQAQAVANSMAKAVGSMAASSLKSAIDKMNVAVKKSTYNAARLAIDNVMANTQAPGVVKVNMFR